MGDGGGGGDGGGMFGGIGDAIGEAFGDAGGFGGVGVGQGEPGGPGNIGGIGAQGMSGAMAGGGTGPGGYGGGQFGDPSGFGGIGDQGGPDFGGQRYGMGPNGAPTQPENPPFQINPYQVRGDMMAGGAWGNYQQPERGYGGNVFTQSPGPNTANQGSLVTNQPYPQFGSMYGNFAPPMDFTSLFGGK